MEGGPPFFLLYPHNTKLTKHLIFPGLSSSPHVLSFLPTLCSLLSVLGIHPGYCPIPTIQGKIKPRRVWTEHGRSSFGCSSISYNVVMIYFFSWYYQSTDSGSYVPMYENLVTLTHVSIICNWCSCCFWDGVVLIYLNKSTCLLICQKSSKLLTCSEWLTTLCCCTAIQTDCVVNFGQLLFWTEEHLPILIRLGQGRSSVVLACFLS